MSEQLFPQNVIAVIWDFDKTLAPGYMQAPLFARYGVDDETFWHETRALDAHYRRAGLTHIASDTMYLNHMLTYVRAGRFTGLDNATLRTLGQDIALHPGLPDLFGALKDFVTERAHWRQHDITLEHYVVSNGLHQMIAGSAVAAHVDGIWGCEFIETPAPPGFLEHEEPAPEKSEISQLGYVIDNTTKTRAVFEINKGSNKDPDIGVNDSIKPEHRRVPMSHMIYVADGPSDIPVFSLVRKGSGRTYAVYTHGDVKAFRQAKRLNDQERVEAFGEADYRPDTPTHMWLHATIEEIADSIATRRERLLSNEVAKTPASY